MNQKVIALFALGMLLACSYLFCDPRGDDYQVWEHVIEMMDPSDLHVLIDHTSCCMESQDTNDVLAGDFDDLKGEVPELSLETTHDFVTRNKRQYPVGNLFTLPNKYAFASDTDLKELIPECCCWEPFYDRFPTSGGFITLSMPGFNKAKDQAIVYYARTSGGLSGRGYMVILAKKGYRWNILKAIEIWIA